MRPLSSPLRHFRLASLKKVLSWSAKILPPAILVKDQLGCLSTVRGQSMAPLLNDRNYGIASSTSDADPRVDTQDPGPLGEQQPSNPFSKLQHFLSQNLRYFANHLFDDIVLVLRLGHVPDIRTGDVVVAKDPRKSGPWERKIVKRVVLVGGAGEHGGGDNSLLGVVADDEEEQHEAASFDQPSLDEGTGTSARGPRTTAAASAAVAASAEIPRTLDPEDEGDESDQLFRGQGQLHELHKGIKNPPRRQHEAVVSSEVVEMLVSPPSSSFSGGSRTSSAVGLERDNNYYYTTTKLSRGKSTSTATTSTKNIPDNIPTGRCWLLGDNLALSNDSRKFGPVSVSLIDGIVVAVVFPFWRMRWLVDEEGNSIG
ncbi:unnamed protein product [Amoebophrya sp. A120]|nr:unnamed protein product [Amoebophrya sp. A120]|eukprot:GSA120T00019204001.1